LTTKTA